MGPNLTQRQIALLEAIIREFMDTAEAVGSIHLPIKYELGVSPATIRNEMMSLVKKGFLQKPHSSSGRIPTSLAFKFFIDKILNENMEDLEVETEVRLKETIFQNRFTEDKLLFEIAKDLARITGNTGIAAFFDRIYYYGIAEMIDIPEYSDPVRLKKLLSVLENYDTLIML